MEPREIWVLPELNDNAEEIGKLSLGLLSEANYIAAKVGGRATALVPGGQGRDYSDILGQYGVTGAYVFKDPLLEHFSAEAYSAALIKKIEEGKPWLLLMGDTPAGRELAPRLAALLGTGLVSNCVRMEMSDPENPRFFRPVYDGQLYQEVVFQTGRTMLVTMAPEVLNITPCPQSVKVKTTVIEPKLAPEAVRVKHLEYLPADFRTVDVTDADVVVSAGMGAVTDDSLALAEELADLIGGAIGTTRPVVDEGKISKERMIGQTGKVISPDLYLALGISGATHHIGGIKDSGKIVAINRDPQAPIFENSDVGVTADIQNILPGLIEKIKQVEKSGKTL